MRFAPQTQNIVEDISFGFEPFGHFAKRDSRLALGLVDRARRGGAGDELVTEGPPALYGHLTFSQRVYKPIRNYKGTQVFPPQTPFLDPYFRFWRLGAEQKPKGSATSTRNAKRAAVARSSAGSPFTLTMTSCLRGVCPKGFFGVPKGAIKAAVFPRFNTSSICLMADLASWYSPGDRKGGSASLLHSNFDRCDTQFFQETLSDRCRQGQAFAGTRSPNVGLN